MLLLQRPPYLRWAGAALILFAALGWDLAGRATEPYPFAADDIVKGEFLSDDNVEWRNVPTGALPPPSLNGVTAGVAIHAGDPIIPSLTTGAGTIPSDSWAVPAPLPLGTATGQSVRLVFPDGTSVPGVIVAPASEDSFGMVSNGLVAVAEDLADMAALASANGDLVVLVEP